MLKYNIILIPNAYTKEQLAANLKVLCEEMQLHFKDIEAHMPCAEGHPPPDPLGCTTYKSTQNEIL